MDEIRIDNLEVFAHHGVFPQENQEGQNFYVNMVLHTDLRPAGLKDESLWRGMSFCDQMDAGAYI